MNKRNRSMGPMVVYMILLAALFIGYMVFARTSTPQQTYTYTQFQTDLAEEKITEVNIRQNEEVPTGVLEVKLKDNGKVSQLYVSDVNPIQDMLREKNIKYNLRDVSRDNTFLTTFLPLLIMIAAMIIVFVMLGRSMGAGGRMSSFGRSKARMTDGGANKVTFKDVAGLDEEKEELVEIVDFLKNPAKYTHLGARIPKGVILTGPPGTGKTLLAKAVAGEAGVPFYSISGSDFVEMFVGVGASRVRDMFSEAKKNAPCIIFIDEIDAVARQRGSGLGGGHDEREQTLNQMLVEMDGFGTNSGIIVMAATNRLDILDPAILRPGRFDRKIAVGRPDVKGRLEILKVHASKKPMADDVDLEAVARTSAGFTGADLENILNEAAISAATKKQEFITNSDLQDAFIKQGIGKEKKSKVISDKEKRITAYHESGHAILFHVLPDVGPVHTVSIIPTGMGAAGYTMPLPEKDELFNTKGKMIQNIIVSMGGRVAEELVFDDVTTGASMDIKQATTVAKDMVTKYGFSSKLGPINYEAGSEEVFIGREIGHSRPFSEVVATQIDEEVKKIVENCYNKAKEIIQKYRGVLDRSAALLLEKEKITREEFEALFNEPAEA